MIFALDFFLRRLSQGVVIVLLVALLIFTLLRIVPGDPVRIMLGPMTSPSVMEETAKRLGLRDPIPFQFGRYLFQVVHGDFGHSFIRGAQGGSTGGSRGQDTFDTRSAFYKRGDFGFGLGNSLERSPAVADHQEVDPSHLSQ